MVLASKPFLFFLFTSWHHFPKINIPEKILSYTFNGSFKFTILSISTSYYSHATWHCIFNIQNPVTGISYSEWQAIELQNMFTRYYSQQKIFWEKKRHSIDFEMFLIGQNFSKPTLQFLIEPYLNSCPFHLHLKEPENNTLTEAASWRIPRNSNGLIISAVRTSLHEISIGSLHACCN